MLEKDLGIFYVFLYVLVQAACAQATEVCKAQGKSIARLAVQYALRNRNVATTLVGMSSVDVVSYKSDAFEVAFDT